jgi:predicted phage replisome organizer
MSKNKRWYFIKLSEDFLESDPIEWLLTQDEGGNYFSLYILLCKIALNTEGRLVRILGNEEVPYTQEDLSHKVRMSSSTVKVGITTLLKAGLLSWIGSDVLYVTHFEMLVGSETDSARRMRKQRRNAASREGMRKLRAERRQALPPGK